MMTILINGEQKAVNDNLSVEGLLKSFHIDPSAVVVERNEMVLPRQRFGETLVTAGDKIEIVRFVGGGA